MPRSEGILVIFCGEFKASLVGGGKVVFSKEVYCTTFEDELRVCNCPACEFAGSIPPGETSPPLDLKKFNPLKRVHVWADRATAERWRLLDAVPAFRGRRGEDTAATSLGSGKICGLFSHGTTIVVDRVGFDHNKTPYGLVATPLHTLFLFAYGRTASIHYPLDYIPHRVKDLILMTRESGKITIGSGNRLAPYFGVVYDCVQVANINSSMTDASAAIMPRSIGCGQFAHYSSDPYDLCNLYHGIRCDEYAKQRYLWFRGEWNNMAQDGRQRVSDEEDLVSVESGPLSDDFIVSDAEAEACEAREGITSSMNNERQRRGEDEDSSEESLEDFGDEESLEDFGDEESLAQAEVQSHHRAGRRTARTKRRLDDTAEFLLQTKSKRPAAAASAKESGMCSICLSESSTHVIYPCGHVAFCDDCYRNPQLDASVCPMCKARAELVMSVDMHAKISSMIVYWT